MTRRSQVDAVGASSRASSPRNGRSRPSSASPSRRSLWPWPMRSRSGPTLPSSVSTRCTRRMPGRTSPWRPSMPRSSTAALRDCRTSPRLHGGGRRVPPADRLGDRPGVAGWDEWPSNLHRTPPLLARWGGSRPGMRGHGGDDQTSFAWRLSRHEAGCPPTPSHRRGGLVQSAGAARVDRATDSIP
jgi:hypothetical protein